MAAKKKTEDVSTGDSNEIAVVVNCGAHGGFTETTVGAIPDVVAEHDAQNALAVERIRQEQERSKQENARKEVQAAAEVAKQKHEAAALIQQLQQQIGPGTHPAIATMAKLLGVSVP